jgi:hypothetical protein
MKLTLKSLSQKSLLQRKLKDLLCKIGQVIQIYQKVRILKVNLLNFESEGSIDISSFDESDSDDSDYLQ